MISTSEVRIAARGDIGDKAKRHAREEVAKVTRRLDDPILFARVKLTLTDDPANQRPAIAQAMLDVNGQPIRAVADGPTVVEAIDLMTERLRHQLEHLTDRRLARRARGPASLGAHEWRHGDTPTARPSYFPRPSEDRQVIRHKSYALEPLTPAEAADQMALLDYDFHLYVDADTGREAIVERVEGDDVRVRLVPDGSSSSDAQPPVPTLDVDDAARLLNLAGQDWLFFVDRKTGRGTVVYRRYDGHDGVVTAA
ncbi:MAG TPA: HPF/RaiA family ribosome-associated protein [Euzebyales bacterium]|nr:HPF/RaiA family ribosome-associated protein [Euzebyales bacterium]